MKLIKGLFTVEYYSDDLGEWTDYDRNMQAADAVCMALAFDQTGTKARIVRQP